MLFYVTSIQFSYRDQPASAGCALASHKQRCWHAPLSVSRNLSNKNNSRQLHSHGADDDNTNYSVKQINKITHPTLRDFRSCKIECIPHRVACHSRESCVSPCRKTGKLAALYICTYKSFVQPIFNCCRAVNSVKMVDLERFVQSMDFHGHSVF